jgi:hypothetical protein
VATIAVDVRGARELVLSANCGGDDPNYDAVNWGFARLIAAGQVDSLEEPPTELRSATEANAALFLAEAHHQLGRVELARRWHGRAATWIEENPTQGERLRPVRDETARRLEGGGH